MNTRCQGVKRDGEPCSLAAYGSDGYCWAHSPSNAEQRRRMASKAGKTRPNVEVADIKRRLSDVAEGVLEGEVDRSVGAVVSQILNVYLRAISIELKVKEVGELEERMKEIEAELEHQGGRWHA